MHGEDESKVNQAVRELDREQNQVRPDAAALGLGVGEVHAGDQVETDQHLADGCRLETLRHQLGLGHHVLLLPDQVGRGRALPFDLLYLLEHLRQDHYLH